MMTIQEIANEAADILSEPDKWCQGRLRKPLCADRDQGNYQVCLSGACLDAIGYFDGVVSDVIIQHAIAASKMAGGPAFNDAPGRTVEEVIAALRRVANGEVVS